METKNIKVEVADPTTLGLFGLAMVTLVASSQKMGLTEGLAFVLPWAIGVKWSNYYCIQFKRVYHALY